MLLIYKFVFAGIACQIHAGFIEGMGCLKTFKLFLFNLDKIKPVKVCNFYMQFLKVVKGYLWLDKLLRFNFEVISTNYYRLVVYENGDTHYSDRRTIGFGQVRRRPLERSCTQIMDMKPHGKRGRPKTRWML